MSKTEVMLACFDAGISLTIAEGRLLATNASALTDELRAGIRQHKEAILAELSLPLIDYVFLLFPDSTEIDVNGRKIKQQPTDTKGLFT